MPSLITTSTLFEISLFTITVDKYQDHILLSEWSAVKYFVYVKVVKLISMSTKYFILHLTISLTPIAGMAVCPSISSMANTC